MKRCTKCGKKQPKSEFNKCETAKDGLHSNCRTCRIKVNAIYNHTHKKHHRDYHFKVKYGLKYKNILDMLRIQKRLCPICNTKMHMREKNGDRAVVDHNHKTGVVRGIICSNCNQMLGKAKDNIWTLHEAIKYLQGLSERSSEVRFPKLD
jgi:hypothetical protein